MSTTVTDGGSSTTVEPKRELWERPLTVRTHNPHRDRPMRLEEHYVSNGRPVSHVTEAAHKLRQYRREKADMKMVFEDGTEPISHRFNHKYAQQKYAQAMDAARILQRQCDDLHTAMLTLRAYEFNAHDEGRAYADHLHDLLASNGPIMRSLRYELGDKRGLEFGRLSVIQPHKTGHAHIQHGLWIDGRVDRDDLQSTVETHLEKCPVARRNCHEGRTITIRKSTAENQMSETLVYELAKDLVGFDDNITSDNSDVRRKYERLGATLMATNINQWRPDNSVFQDAIERGKDEYEYDYRGEYEGIQFEEGGAVYDPSELGGKGSGVTMVDVTDVEADDPIPTDL